MTLTIDQIKDLAQFAGLHITGEAEDKESEITIIECPKEGIKDDDGSTIVHYRHVAYLEEYPEEGVCPLGDELVQSEEAK